MALAGIMVPLSMAPYHWSILIYFSLAYYLYGIQNSSFKQVFWLGFSYGLGLFGWGASWVFVSIYHYGNTTALIASVITLLFIAILSLFPGLIAVTLNLVAPKYRHSRYLFIFPALWVAFEALRGWIFTGFPWLYVGYSQESLMLSYLAPYGGIWSVSYATALMGGLFFNLFRAFNHSRLDIKKEIIIFLIGIVGLWGVSGWIKKGYQPITLEPALEVALVQGNIEQSMKWDADRANTIIQTYYQLSQAHLDMDLIIWPETAIPWPIPMANELLDNLQQEFYSKKVYLISGVPEYNTQNQAFNSIIALGAESHKYQKQHLVPFGEYVPLENWIRGLIGFFDLPMSSFKSGPINQPLFEIKNFKIAPTLCYEIAYPELVRRNARGSDLLLTLSNDAWFGQSIGPHQHLQIAQFRALENGKFLIRSTNNGWTTIINPEGKVVERLPRFEKGVLRGTVRATAYETFWNKNGPIPFIILIALFSLIGLIDQCWARFKKY